MPEQIPIPVTIVNPDRPFDDLITHITQTIAARQCTECDCLHWKTIDAAIAINNSTILISCIDQTIAVLSAQIVDSNPVLNFLNANEIISTVALREKILAPEILNQFAIKRKSAEEMRLAEVKAIALSKLTAEEIAALGLG